MSWTWREYDPFRSEIAERGPITAAAAVDLFQKYDWKTQLAATAARPKDVVCAPGFELTDSVSRTFYVGGAGDGNSHSFVVGYIRPMMVRKLTFIGFKEKLDPKHYSDIEIGTGEEVLVLLNAFLENRTEELNKRFG